MSNELENTAAEAMPEKWVNLEDIADHLSVSTDTVRNWIKDGKAPDNLILTSGFGATRANIKEKRAEAGL